MLLNFGGDCSLNTQLHPTFYRLPVYNQAHSKYTRVEIL